MTYIWVNNQHNGANGSSEPLNMVLFLRKHGNNQQAKYLVRNKFWLGWGDLIIQGGTKLFSDWGYSPFMGYSTSLIPMLGSPEYCPLA